MNRYTKIDNSLFKLNRKNLSKNIKENSVVVLNSNNEYLRNGDVLHKYRQNSNLFYLCGIEQPESILFITNSNESYLFTTRPEPTIETWIGRKLRTEESTAISGIENVYYLDELEVMLPEILEGKTDIYFDIKFDEEPEIPSRDLIFYNKYKNAFKNLKHHEVNEIMIKLRAVKSKIELELINKAIRITEKAFNSYLKAIKPGIKEYELEAELSYIFNKNGATHSFHPIVASGSNACTLHYDVNSSECKDGEMILLDFGAEYGNYAADISRTVPANGKFSDRQKECYNAVLEVQLQAIKLVKAGTTVNRINAQVVELMEKAMIKLGLFTEEDIKNQDVNNKLYFNYYMHGASHLLGIDVHDLGFRNKDMVLKEGMIITMEPGIYIKEEGIGIRIEDDILITKDGNKNLTSSVPKKIEEIEKLMNA